MKSGIPATAGLSTFQRGDGAETHGCAGDNRCARLTASGTVENIRPGGINHLDLKTRLMAQGTVLQPKAAVRPCVT
ncbi:hypothetical protein KIF59_08650 [Enterobacter cloacae subsp. cloacae]|nr:hypothetical protein [Enterobacter cloacae subsp. cloacae]